MPIKEFIPLGLQSNRIEETLKIDGDFGRIQIMCLKPMLYGMWLSPNETCPVQLLTHTNGVVLCKVNGHQQHIIPTQQGSFMLWSPENTDLLTLSLKEKLIELPQIFRQSRKSKFHFVFKEISHLAAAYLYPRKIYIVVVQAEDYLNIFPMDLHLANHMSHGYAFALQGSNLATEKMKTGKRVLVCEIDKESLSVAYALGKNHGRTNLVATKLPFICKESQTFAFSVPEFVIGYHEVEIDQFEELGSHTLFLGKVVHKELDRDDAHQPFHAHRFFANFLRRNGDLKNEWKL